METQSNELENFWIRRLRQMAERYRRNNIKSPIAMAEPIV